MFNIVTLCVIDHHFIYSKLMIFKFHKYDFPWFKEDNISLRINLQGYKRKVWWDQRPIQGGLVDSFTDRLCSIRSKVCAYVEKQLLTDTTANRVIQTKPNRSVWGRAAGSVGRLSICAKYRVPGTRHRYDIVRTNNSRTFSCPLPLSKYYVLLEQD